MKVNFVKKTTNSLNICITVRTLISEDEVIGKYGLHPKYLSDFFALTGDSADNIPGVKGVQVVVFQLFLIAFNCYYVDLRSGSQDSIGID